MTADSQAPKGPSSESSNFRSVDRTVAVRCFAHWFNTFLVLFYHLPRTSPRLRVIFQDNVVENNQIAGTGCPSKKERRIDKEAKRKDCGTALYADQQSETLQSDQERLAVMTGLCTISKLVCYTSLFIFIIYHVKEKESNYCVGRKNKPPNGNKRFCCVRRVPRKLLGLTKVSGEEHMCA